MADLLELEIVTPDKLLVKEPADEVQIPGKAGYLDVLPGHAPLITELMASPPMAPIAEEMAKAR